MPFQYSRMIWNANKYLYFFFQNNSGHQQPQCWHMVIFTLKILSSSGRHLKTKCCLTSIGIPIIKIRLSHNCLVFIMGIPITKERQSLYWEGPQTDSDINTFLHMPIVKISYTLSREYRVVRSRYSRLLFTSEDRLCANLRVQEQSTNMTSQCQ